MTKSRINIGIDLGTTNSSIAKLERSNPKIVKSDVLKDTTPSCVGFTIKQSVVVGDKAHTFFSRERWFALKDSQYQPNAFVEFKRTIGTDTQYFCSNTNKNYSSEDLSAEILKKLKSYVADESISSAVITIPAKFTINQKDATVRAAKLAGFTQVELLQEPIAASMAYGLDSVAKDGIWLVFDLGGGTFDAALLRVEDGIMKVFDTEGDNHLGGKNIDEAIVDEFLIPYLSDNFLIESFLNNDRKRKIMRDAWKAQAEAAKIELSAEKSVEFGTVLGEDYGEDDDGVAIELDLELTEAELKPIQEPFFQRAIDTTKDLLKRNNLSGNNLQTVILVGGPTYSLQLRRMITEQISERIDYSVDPMTVVARGAALYASTIPVSEEILNQTRDRTKLQLEIKYESTTIEEEEFVTIKILPDRTDGAIPDVVFVEFARADKAWISERIAISPQGEMITVKLETGKVNVFQVNLFDNKANRLPCEPQEISIIQGSKILPAPLPHNYGIEIRKKDNGRAVYKTIPGLEKNTPNAKGKGKYQIQNILRCGISEDVVRIPFLEADIDADGSRAIYQELVYEYVITGKDVPETIPSGTEIELNFTVKGEQFSCVAYFPQIDFTLPLRTPQETVRKIEKVEELQNELDRAYNKVFELQDDFYADSVEVEAIENELDDLADQMEKSGFEKDTRSGVLDRLRKCFRRIDKIIDKNEWNNLEDELLRRLSVLEEANEESGNPRTTRQLVDFQRQAEKIIENKNVNLANELLDNINSLIFALTWFEQTKWLLESWRNDYEDLNRQDQPEFQGLLRKGFMLVERKANFEELRPVMLDLIKLLPEDEKSKHEVALLWG